MKTIDVLANQIAVCPEPLRSWAKHLNTSNVVEWYEEINRLRNQVTLLNGLLKKQSKEVLMTEGKAIDAIKKILNGYPVETQERILKYTLDSIGEEIPKTATNVIPQTRPQGAGGTSGPYRMPDYTTSGKPLSGNA